MAEYARRSPRCLITPSQTIARRWWWRTLDFANARATGTDTLGRRKRGKRLRRTVAGLPTRRFRDRLIGMATRRGIAVIGVDPAYTSKWGNQHWRKPLQQQASHPVTGHHGAAAAIGRRGLGLAIRRR